MEWWLWAVLGIALLSGEILAPTGFFLLFFGFAGLVVAFLTGIGIGGPAWLQWVLFALVAIVFLLLLRRRFLHWAHRDTKKVDALEAESAVSRAQIAPGEVGQVELRGAVWNGRNVGTTAIDTGDRLQVIKVDGLTLEVQRES